MALIHYHTMPKLAIWPGITGSVYHSDQATIGHIDIEDKVELPTHAHPHEQWSHVIEGIFEFNIDGEIFVLEKGMSMYIPPNVPHSGKARTACRIIDCFVPAREDWKTLPFAGIE
ncbi:MAG: cupin domain-containing protein [Saprospiraceae bacterium]|nr:cupin domain-containing protein [Saprospiraceae bacterium]